MRSANKVVVIGAGVSGLTCALKLRELGLQTIIWARDRPEQTVSMVAAAIWHPYLVSPRQRVRGWAIESFRAFTALTELSESGVRFIDGAEIPAEPDSTPEWAIEEMKLRHHPATPERPAHYTFRSVVIDTSVYIPWLRDRYLAEGGTIMDRTVGSLDEAFREAPLVVNCAGLGARSLTGDTRLHAVKGQVVRVARGASDGFLFDERDPMRPIYIIPRENDIVLGGTAEPGVEDPTPDPRTQESIIDRCAALIPSLRAAETLGTSAGLRPGRDEVRLEPEIINGKGLLVHNYGHGGAGVTLSIGCALEVRSLVATAIGAVSREVADCG